MKLFKITFYIHGVDIEWYTYAYNENDSIHRAKHSLSECLSYMPDEFTSIEIA